MQWGIALLLAAHLICVGVAAVAPLWSVWWEIRDARQAPGAAAAGRFLSLAAVALMLLGAVFGVLVGLLRWDAELAGAISAARSRVFYGVLEVVFSLVLLVGHAVWWRLDVRPAAWRRGLRYFLAFLAGTNLLYHFPLLFYVLAEMQRSGEYAETLTSAQFRGLMLQPLVLARTLHFSLAAVITTGAVAMLWAARRADWDEDHKVTAITGSRLAFGATVLQLPTGLWVFMQLPATQQNAMLGGNVVSVCAMAASMLCVLGMLHFLSATALGDATRRNSLLGVLLIVLTVVLMTVSKHFALAG